MLPLAVLPPTLEKGFGVEGQCCDSTTEARTQGGGWYPDWVLEQKRGLVSSPDAVPCNFSSGPFLFVFASCML